METYIYSNAIQILGARGGQIGSAEEMPKAEGKRFVSTVKDALKQLAKLRTGRALINTINNSGHRCRIFCASPGNEGAALADPPTLQNNAKRMIRSFRPQQLNMLPQSKQFTQSDGGKKVFGQIKAKLQEAGLHQSRAVASSELDFILIRAWGTEDAGRKALVQQLGKQRQVIDDMCDGIIKIEDDDYYRICFAYLMHLRPGPGCDTQVKLKAEVRLESAGSFKPKTDVNAVAAEIILGHELLHACRMMIGRRIVDHGWEEEAMTVGCNPFTHLQVTENSLRREGGYPIRNSYPPTSMSTSFGAQLSF